MKKKINPIIFEGNVTVAGAYESKQITIPKPICNLLNIKKGDVVNITIDDDLNIVVWKKGR